MWGHMFQSSSNHVSCTSIVFVTGGPWLIWCMIRKNMVILKIHYDQCGVWGSVVLLSMLDCEIYEYKVSTILSYGSWHHAKLERNWRAAAVRLVALFEFDVLHYCFYQALHRLLTVSIQPHSLQTVNSPSFSFFFILMRVHRWPFQ